jgi:hypothetical protein
MIKGTLLHGFGVMVWNWEFWVCVDWTTWLYMCTFKCVISPPSFSTIQVHYKHDLKIRMILWLIWKQVEGFLHQKGPTDIWMYVQREVLQSSIGVWPPWRNLVNTCHHKFFLLLFSVHESMWPIFFSLQAVSHVSFHQHPDALSLQHQFFAYAWSPSLQGHIIPSSSDWGSSGNILVDFYWVISNLCATSFFSLCGAISMHSWRDH